MDPQIAGEGKEITRATLFPSLPPRLGGYGALSTPNGTMHSTRTCPTDQPLADVAGRACSTGSLPDIPAGPLGRGG